MINLFHMLVTHVTAWICHPHSNQNVARYKTQMQMSTLCNSAHAPADAGLNLDGKV